MTDFYKLALKISLIMNPPTTQTHSEMLSLMFRNSADVQDRVLNAGIPDFMRAPFWAIMSGAEVNERGRCSRVRAARRNPFPSPPRRWRWRATRGFLSGFVGRTLRCALLFHFNCFLHHPDMHHHCYRCRHKRLQEGQEKKYSDKIRRDIHRTFPEDAYFQSAPDFMSKREVAPAAAAAASSGQDQARVGAGGQEVQLGQGQEVLLVVNRAYSLYDKAIGYCQGMNFIVAGIAMHQRNAELTFWTLERIMHHYKIGMWFVPQTPDLSIALFRISNIVEMLNPRLHAHYAKHDVDIGFSICHKWIVTLFIDPFPREFA